jgi:diguanylate cyclase (GGDEF)-like protein/PAS domain S-box-containing protein
MTGSSADDHFEALYHSAPCGLLFTAVDGMVIEVNDTLLGWIGVSREDVVGHPFSTLLDTGSRLFYETRQVPVLQLSGTVEVSLLLRKADGDTLPVLLNSVLTTDPEQGRVGVRTAIFDASARQEYERELLLARRAAEESEARVAALQDASTAFGSSTSERGLADALAEAARVAFAAVEAGTFLLDDGVFRLAGGTYPLEEWIPIGSVGIGGTSVASEMVVTLGDLKQVRAVSERLADAMEAAHITGMSVAPMLEDGVAVGIFVCWYARQRTFDDQFVEVQEALGRQAAQTLLRLRLQRQLEQLALHDQLTGLANRVLIQDEVNRAIAASRRDSRPMAVIFIDLDGFKAVNDRLGHGAGDSVLRQVAERLRTGVRQQDTVGRIGGDEFIAICEDADEEAATGIAERIRSLIDQPLDDLPDWLSVTASLGVTVLLPDEDSEPTSDELLNLADDAMYRSKSTGKNLVTVQRR